MGIEVINNTGSRSTLDISTPFDSGDADYLLACTMSALNGGPSTVKFDGVDLTKYFSYSDTYNPSGSDQVEFAFWVLPNPHQGVFTLDIDANAVGIDTFFWWVFALKGVHPDTPIAGTDFSSERHSGSAPTINLNIDTTFVSLCVTMGTVYFNAGEYHQPGPGFTDLYDQPQIQTNSSGGQYLAYGAFSIAGTVNVGGHDNFIATNNASKQVEVAILINSTEVPTQPAQPAKGSFFHVL